MIREVRYATVSFEEVREDHLLDGGGNFLGSLGGANNIVPAGFVWLVDRIIFRFAGATAGPVRLYGSQEATNIYIGDTVDSFLLPAGATYPLENTADEVNAVIVKEGRRFVLDARGGDPGSRIFINVAYRIGQLQQIFTPEIITLGASSEARNNDHPAGSNLGAPVRSRRPLT